MAVVDASTLIDAFLGDERSSSAIVGRDLHAPVTVDAEILHGLRRAWLAGVITEADANSVIALAQETAITRHPVQSLVNRIWQLRFNVTAYDAAYVALAEKLDLPLLTRDRRLAQSSGHAARITYID
jgi:predicted nucleic acid-binding protein